MRRLLSFVAILVLSGLTACAPRVVATLTPTPQILPSPTASLTPEATLPPTATASPTPLPSPTAPPAPRLQYVLSARLDLATHRVDVVETIFFPNPTSQPLEELLLVVQPNWQPGVFTLHRVTDAQGTEIADTALDGIRLSVPLPAPLAPGEGGELHLEYSLTLPRNQSDEAYGPTAFGYTLRQTNLVDWYPFVPPYDPENGWVVHHPWYYGENLVYPMADFDVALEVVNAPQNTLIAASALDQGDGSTHRYHLENGRNFALSISPSYVMQEQQVGNTLVRGYYFPQQRIGGQAAFQTTIEALQLYSQLFGEYPYPSLTMVEADFLHGMEYQGLYFLSRGFFDTYEGKPESFLISIAAHETAHQWWYGLVGNDQALEPWLDEALCTYSERIFYERLYPEALDWWWFARINYYQPDGWVDSVLHYTEGYLPYRNAVYLNGARFLEDVRQSIGDEAFFAFLRAYAETYSGQIATGADFFALLHQFSSVDLSAITRQYFQTPP